MDETGREGRGGRGGALVLHGEDDDVRRKLDDVRFADYFALLELDREGPLLEGAVDVSWQRLVRRFDPTRFSGRLTPEIEAALAEIRDGLADAREVLGDPLLRERYRRNIRSDHGFASGGPSDSIGSVGR